MKNYRVFLVLAIILLIGLNACNSPKVTLGITSAKKGKQLEIKKIAGEVDPEEYFALKETEEKTSAFVARSKSGTKVVIAKDSAAKLQEEYLATLFRKSKEAAEAGEIDQVAIYNNLIKIYKDSILTTNKVVYQAEPKTPSEEPPASKPKNKKNTQPADKQKNTTASINNKQRNSDTKEINLPIINDTKYAIVINKVKGNPSVKDLILYPGDTSTIKIPNIYYTINFSTYPDSSIPDLDIAKDRRISQETTGSAVSENNPDPLRFVDSLDSKNI